MTFVQKREASVRACCSIGDEVWAAKQDGGVSVFDAVSGEWLGDANLSISGGTPNPQVLRLCAVFDQVWASTLDGDLVCISASSRSSVSTVSFPGEVKKARLVALQFNGHVVAAACEDGNVYLIHPLQRRVRMTLSVAEPCSAMCQYYSFIVVGDSSGRLTVWDALAGVLVVSHDRSRSAPTVLLHEPTTGKLWVARENGNVDIYELDADRLNLVKRLSAFGKVTGLDTVSGLVMASTYEKRVLCVDAATFAVSELTSGARAGSRLGSRRSVNVEAVHTAFIHGLVKVRHSECARLWSFANDSSVLVWDVCGAGVPVHPPPLLHPTQQARLVSQAQLDGAAGAAVEGAAAASEELMQAFRQDDLRALREEAQELRLKLLKTEKSLHVKDDEVTTLNKRIAELNEENAKLSKSVTEANAKVAATETERSSLQTELSNTKEELSKARTETAAKVTEKTTAEQELSKQKNENGQLEQRLREAEGKAADLRAENSRLCNSLGGIASGQSAEAHIQSKIVESSAKLNDELQQIRRMNLLLSSVVASMEYTIRRKEEEEKDMTALLNAFRRKVAGHVADPFLSALLLASMVRNPARFDLECDEFTKQQLMNHSSPFIQFMQSFRMSDPQSYEKLIAYLRQLGAAGGDGLSPEDHDLLEKFLGLASNNGAVPDDVMLAFKRSIPNFFDSNTVNASGTAGTAGGNGANAGTGDGTKPEATTTTTVTTTTTTTTGAAGGAGKSGNGGSLDGSGDMASYVRFLNGDKPVEAVASSALREIQTQRAMDESFMREHKTLFEFILKTRRTLVECLVLLQKRTDSARQVVDALITSSLKIDAAKDAASREKLNNMFIGIMKELSELTTTIVTKFLTDTEKQRLGI